MTMTKLLLAELEREAPRTRRALEQVPLGQDNWKPHQKSMPLGRLAGLVASMPSWVPLIINQDELDLTPPPGGGQYQQPSTNELIATLDERVASGNRDELAAAHRVAHRTRGNGAAHRGSPKQGTAPGIQGKEIPFPPTAEQKVGSGRQDAGVGQVRHLELPISVHQSADRSL